MSKLIIDLLSDTHNQHEKFQCEGGDILIHSGDCTGRGSIAEAIKFLDWYAKQDYSHLIMIPGNHDWAFEKHTHLMNDEAKNRGIHLLNDSGLIVKDMLDQNNDYLIKIWGSPVQPWFHSWAFNRQRGADIKRHWDLIAPDTEILITHGPPYGLGDEVTMVNGDSYDPPQFVGCEDLLNHINNSQVKLHVSGHIHEGRGVRYEKDRCFVNASSLDRMYYPAAKKPIRLIREMHQDGSISYIEQQ